jgi:hypothetical protein
VRFLLVLFTFALIWADIGAAQSVYEPKRGSAERKALMNAIRPEAERMLGKPVQFVVKDLRVSGNAGYASLSAQRPGGKAINMKSTPFSKKYGYDPNIYPGLYVLYRKKSGNWSVVASELSPFEPPFMDAASCRTHKVVLKGWC